MGGDGLKLTLTLTPNPNTKSNTKPKPKKETKERNFQTGKKREPSGFELENSPNPPFHVRPPTVPDGNSLQTA